MSLPKSSINGNFPDNSEFQLSDSMKSQDALTKKVIQGKAIEGKNNALTAARDSIFYQDGESIGSTIMETVVNPAIRELTSNIVGSFFDIIKESIDRIIFKDDPYRMPVTRYSRMGGGNNYNVPYSSIFNPNNSYYNVGPGYNRGTMYNNNQVIPAPNSPTIPNRYNNIILENRGEAETFIDDLLFTVNQYQSISVANVYAKLDWPSTFQDTKWGWTPDILNPSTIIKRRVANGAWRVTLPKPVPVDI